jgi:hypothetical protein
MKIQKNVKSSISKNKLPHRKIMRSSDEKEAWCRSWRESDLSMREFCEQNNLPNSTFHKWCQNQCPTEKNNPNSNFSPAIVISPVQNKKEGLVNIEIVLPNQTMIRLSLTRPGIVSFIEELSYAATTIR